MSNRTSTTTNAVIFNEGTGYFLVSALTHGQKAQSYTTRSLADGNLYARKKLTADYVNLVPHSDIKFAQLIHPSITPELVHSTQYNHVSDALYFKFCNGGDLRQLIDLYVKAGEHIPEKFIWHFLKSACEHIAALHYPVDFRAHVDPLIHRDIWQGNFFLQWADEAQLPEILLGDFGAAQYVSEGDVGRGPTGIVNDIYSIAFVLLVLVLGKPLAFAGKDIQQSEVRALIPDLYSEELKDVAVEMSRHVVGTRFRVSDQQILNWSVPNTLELASSITALAAEKLAEGEVPDLGWTKPEVSDTPLFFEDEEELDDWCETNNQGRRLSGRWKLVPVQRDTLTLLRRSERLNPGATYQRPEKRMIDEEED